MYKISYELTFAKKIESKYIVIASLLHDIGKWNNFDNHEIHGLEFAKGILTKMNYSSNVINDICFCITNHIYGASKNNTIASQIVANADYISYIKNFDYFKEYEYKNNKSLK